MEFSVLAVGWKLVMVYTSVRIDFAFTLLAKLLYLPFMRTSTILISYLVFMVNCMGQTPKEGVFTKNDSTGRVVERWGNENLSDSEMNFREFYFYNDEGKLTRKIYFSFQDDNVNCVIAPEDSLRYTEFKYIYENDSLLLEQRCDPLIDAKARVTGHKLTFVYNHKLKREDVTSPTYGK